MKDIIKEEAYVLAENNITIKDIQPSVSKIAKLYFIAAMES
jgi:hypothetical protein